MAEGAPLLREYTLIAYRGFESLTLRHYLWYSRSGLNKYYCDVKNEKLRFEKNVWNIFYRQRRREAVNTGCTQ